MGAATGILGGALALSALQLVLSSSTGTSAFGALATVPAGWLEKFMDPRTALIPDHSISAPAAAAGSAAGSAAQVPAPSSLPPTAPTTTLSV